MALLPPPLDPLSKTDKIEAMSQEKEVREVSNIDRLSYDQAMAEVEKILSQLDNAALPVDTILSESRRVVALIAHCRKKMTQVNTEVQQILKELREESNPTE